MTLTLTRRPWYTKLTCRCRFISSTCIPKMKFPSQGRQTDKDADRRNWKHYNAHSQRSLIVKDTVKPCLLYTSPSPRDGLLSRMPSSAWKKKIVATQSLRTSNLRQKQAFQSVADHPQTWYTNSLFCFYDLDRDLMTLTHKLDLKIPKTYLDTGMNFLG